MFAAAFGAFDQTNQICYTMVRTVQPVQPPADHLLRDVDYERNGRGMAGGCGPPRHSASLHKAGCRRPGDPEPGNSASYDPKVTEGVRHENITVPRSSCVGRVRHDAGGLDPAIRDPGTTTSRSPTSPGRATSPGPISRTSSRTRSSTSSAG
jgi:hypothetical protein